MLSGSGSSSIKIHSITEIGVPLGQTLEKAHGLGCHHIATSKNGLAAASVGFGGELRTWALKNGQWIGKGDVVGAISFIPIPNPACLSFIANQSSDSLKAGEAWAIALSEDGQYLASTSYNGRINVWDTVAGGAKIREFETKGSFGMAIDLVSMGLAI